MTLSVKYLPVEDALQGCFSQKLVESPSFISNGHWCFEKKHIAEWLTLIRSLTWDQTYQKTDQEIMKIFPEFNPADAFKFVPTRYIDGYDDEIALYVTDEYSAFNKKYFWLISEHLGFSIVKSGDKKKRRREPWSIINDNNQQIGCVMPTRPNQLASVWRSEDRREAGLKDEDDD